MKPVSTKPGKTTAVKAKAGSYTKITRIETIEHVERAALKTRKGG